MGKILLTMKAGVRLVVAGSLLLAFSTSAFAQNDEGLDGYIAVTPGMDISNPNIKNLKYQIYMGDYGNPSYNLVRTAMEPTFKGTSADKNAKTQMNPTISAAEYDLNADKNTEIIAVPIENSSFGNEFCGAKGLCPHYVLDFSTGKAKVLGVIHAFAVDRGDDIKNGFWTLKAFTKQTDEKNFSYYDLYAYDKQKKMYEKLSSSDADTKPPELKK